MQKYPPLSTSDREPDPAAYHRIIDPFYRGAFDAGRQVRLVHAAQLSDRMTPAEAATRHPVLIAAALYVVDDATIDWLAAYAQAGGHLVLGPRTAYADHEARARPETQPARLVEAAGVRYDEFSNLRAPIAVNGLTENATATHWADGLTVINAEVLAEYDHPHFGRWPAITTRAHGEGRVTCVGTVPGRDLARALAEWLVPLTVHGWRDLPASVTATTGTSADGRRVHVLHNWSWEPARAKAPVDLTDVLADGSVPAGTEVELGAWDVRVFVSVPTD
jgi:beta-galactosidase